MNCRFTLPAYHTMRGGCHNNVGQQQFVNPIWRNLASCKVRTAAHG